MNIIVSGSFRCGSTTLYNTLVENSNGEVEISKVHSGGLYNELVKNKIILVPVRNEKEVCISGLFQDIYCPVYPYSIFHNEENIKIWNENKDLEYFKQKYSNEIMGNEELIYDHFKKINFKNHIDLQNNGILSQLKFVKKIRFEKMGFTINNYPKYKCKICFIDFRILNDINLLNVMLEKLNVNIFLRKLVVSNKSEDNVIYSDYLKLKQRLGGNYFGEYYDFLNDGKIYDVLSKF